MGYPIIAIKIDPLIHTVRGCRVMLDSDLARIYGVSSWHLNQAVKRNRVRFPDDFMFQLTRAESDSLTSQFVMSKRGRGGRRTLPYAFTEHGAVMLSAVLRTPIAIAASIEVVRAFNRLRLLARSHEEFLVALKKLERRVGTHDRQLQTLFATIREIADPDEAPRKKIGFAPG